MNILSIENQLNFIFKNKEILWQSLYIHSYVYLFYIYLLSYMSIQIKE